MDGRPNRRSKTGFSANFSGVLWTGRNVALSQFPVQCDDIEIIDHCLIAIVVLNAIGAVLVLSGSVIGCMGTCCAQQNVREKRLFILAHQAYYHLLPYPNSGLSFCKV